MNEFHWYILGRLLLALVLGSVIGFERALRDKPAGLRTNILICLGACIFTLGSQALSGPMVDKTRIAAQIVTGVGFLGAGAIIRDAKGIVGLTTAATIWSVAAVGMAVGLGEFTLATAGAAAVLLVLLGFPFLGSVIETRRSVEEYRFLTPKTVEQIDRVEEIFARASLRIVLNEYYEKGDKIFFTIKAMGPRESHRKLRRDLLIRDDIRLAKTVE
ncbi:MAG: MgtC/SapB family protein [Phycisphaerae bacterium]